MPGKEESVASILGVAAMKVGLEPVLSDAHMDLHQGSTQRQLSLAIEAIADQSNGNQLPLNLCLVLDHSGSMGGAPLDTVKEAAAELVAKLTPQDQLAIVAFDHRAKVLVDHQNVVNVEAIRQKIHGLKAEGGTAIDEGMKLGLQELAKGKENRVSQIFLLTDGENEHGNNEMCLKLAQLAAETNITLNTLGFGDNWNQDVLEKIADRAGGTLEFIEEPTQAGQKFAKLFTRAQSVGLTNAHLLLDLMPQVRLAELKPIAQVAPETIELPIQRQGETVMVRLGDLMTDDARVILVNLYIGQLPAGTQAIASVRVRYDNPALGQTELYSEPEVVTLQVQAQYQPQPNPQVQKSILALAKYRQTQLAETKLQQGDSQGAATLLQTAAKTALQLGDENAATVLQTNATRLQSGEGLSESERKKTRIVSKTILQ